MTAAAGPSRIPASLHPFSAFGRLQPARSWAAVRAIDPAYADAVTGMRFLTGYRWCRRALTDPAFSAASGQDQRAREDELPRTMLNTDGDEHRRLREAAAGVWSGRGVQRQGQVWAEVAQRAAAALPTSADPLDLVDEFVTPFAVHALAAVLGLPENVQAEFGRLASAAAPNLDPLLRGPAAVQAAGAARRLDEFLAGQRAERRASGAETDLAGLPWSARLSDPERVALLALLVVGGFEPLVAAIAGSIWMLWENPWARAQIDDDPERVAAVVEETLRLHSPIPFTARVCRTDVLEGSDRLPAGTAVLAVISAANRDPDVFPDPDTFRLDRPTTPAHLAFGGGAHFCLGAPLVRAAAVAALTALFDRCPGLAAAGPVRWSATTVPRRLVALPARW